MNTIRKLSELWDSPFGSPAPGGFYAGRIMIAGAAYALVVASKAAGEHADCVWNRSQKVVEGALSYNDGLANTLAMVAAGSALAKWAQELNIDGNDDFYLPSVDELEVIYRNLKPGTQSNSLWARSGINVSAIPPTYPYTESLPVQTANELFRTGGAEAFDEVPYWTSTQHASRSDCAWGQYFGYGDQYGWIKSGKLRARALRRLPL